LNACKIELEHTRANANDELIETLRDSEQDEGYRFSQMQKEWDNQLKDPNDVFFEANKRKEEIRDQIEKPAAGLDLLKPHKANARRVRKKKVSHK
jgi:hypothetical protein